MLLKLCDINQSIAQESEPIGKSQADQVIKSLQNTLEARLTDLRSHILQNTEADKIISQINVQMKELITR